MNRDPQAWARLGHLLKQARLARGLKQSELADQADVSSASVQAAEAGTVPKTRMPTTIGPIAATLGWPIGAVDTVLEGGEPPTVEVADGWQDVPVQQQIDAELLEGVITSAIVRATDSVTSAEIRAATKIALDELRRQGYLAETNSVQPSTNSANT